MADAFNDDLNFFFNSADSNFFNYFFSLILGKVCFVVSSATLPRKQTEKSYIRQLQYLR